MLDCGLPVDVWDSHQTAESFRDLALRLRGRTGLTQRELAARTSTSVRAVQNWEAGIKFPAAESLQALIRAYFEAGGLTAGREADEARALWAAVRRDAPRMHTPFDEEWFARVLADSAAPRLARASNAVERADAATTLGQPSTAVVRTQDWGEAPDTTGFVGRARELALLQDWVLEDRCRVVAVLGMGGIGKTSLAVRLAQQLAPRFERVYWRSVRNAPPISEWLAGAIGSLSDRHLVPPPAESERLTALLQLLRAMRCLLVLDNSETLLAPGQPEGMYRAGMEGYGRLLQAVGEASHQSCLLFTSGEVHRGELYALRRVGDQLAVGKVPRGDTATKVRERRFRHVVLERTYRFVGRDGGSRQMSCW